MSIIGIELLARARRPIAQASRTLTQRELYYLARSMGASVAKGKLVSAINMAESGGKTDAVNTNSNGSKDVGIGQINDVHGYSVSARKNPVRNMHMQKKISSNWTDFSPWVAYTSGAYLRFMYKTGSFPNQVPSGFSPSSGGNVGPTMTQGQAQAIASFEGGLPGTLALFGIPGTPSIPIPGGGSSPRTFVPGLDQILQLKDAGDALGGIPGVSAAADAVLPQQIEDFFRLFNHMFEAEFWFKVGKVLLGVTALYVGVNALMKISTGVDPVRATKRAVATAGSIAATKGVGTAGKVT